MRAYLDYNATAPLRGEARDAMIAAMDIVGNPASVHAEGRAAKALIEKARADVAEAVGCKPQEVVFTSGATEAARVLSGFEAVDVEPTAHDCLRVHAKGEGGLRALGLVNSETGVISDVPEGAGLVDVVQAIGRVPFAFGWAGVDFAVLSAHKLGGPKGVGALIVREGVEIPALAMGGGQEMGRRSGTENVIGIAGFGAAIRAAMRDLEQGEMARQAALRDQLEARIGADHIVGAGENRVGNTSCILTPGWKGETQVMLMDLAGFAISAGSACSSGKVRASHVLTAMGYAPEEAASAIRVSVGRGTTEDEITRFADSWCAAREKHLAKAA